MTKHQPQQTPRTLTTAKVAFLGLAAVAPMGVAVSIVPLAFAYGGASTTAMYMVVGIVLLCFATGYAEMGKSLPTVGTLYSFIRQDLGSIPAAGGALLALQQRSSAHSVRPFILFR